MAFMGRVVAMLFQRLSVAAVFPWFLMPCTRREKHHHPDEHCKSNLKTTKMLDIVDFLLVISFVHMVGGYVANTWVPCVSFSGIFCLTDNVDEG